MSEFMTNPEQLVAHLCAGQVITSEEFAVLAGIPHSRVQASVRKAARTLSPENFASFQFGKGPSYVFSELAVLFFFGLLPANYAARLSIARSHWHRTRIAALERQYSAIH